MKNIYLLVIFFYSILTFTSCKDKSYHTKDEVRFSEIDFKNKKVLDGERLDLEMLYKPVYIQLIPNYNLLIAIEVDGDFFGKVYSLDSLQYIKSFIEKGKGPDAQLSTSTIQYSEEENLLYVADIYKRQLFAYEVDSLNDINTQSKPSKVIDFHSLEIMKPLVVTSDKIIDLYPSYHKDSISSLGFYNSNGDLKFHSGEYPLKSRDYEPFELLSVFISGLSVSKNKDKILLNYYYTDYLDVFDIDGNLEKRIKGPGNFEAEFEGRSIGEGRSVFPGKKAHRAYSSNAKMNDSTLVLYNGNSVKNSDYHADKLFLLDEEFLPKTIYTLNQPIFTFDIDWSKGFLYGLSHQDEKTLIKYKLW